MVFWLRARMISADAPRTSARFIFNRGDVFADCTCTYTLPNMNSWFKLNWLSYFIDHCISEGLLFSSGGFAVIHIHRNYPNPWLLILPTILSFSSARLYFFILNLKKENTWCSTSGIPYRSMCIWNGSLYSFSSIKTRGSQFHTGYCSIINHNRTGSTLDRLTRTSSPSSVSLS